MFAPFLFSDVIRAIANPFFADPINVIEYFWTVFRTNQEFNLA
jgi:hypothetical protein